MTTPSGDFVLAGGDASDVGLVKFDGPTQATRVTYSLTDSKLIVNGSGGNDHFRARVSNDNPLYGSLVVNLDANSLVVTAQDKLVFEPNEQGGPSLMTLMFNLNSGDDWFDATGLNQGVYVNGGNGRDNVHGGLANDSLYGGDGEDMLIGGGGKDTIMQ